MASVKQSPLDAVAIKYLSLVKNFLQKENPRKLVQFSRVQRLLIMKAITPEQWTKLVSELFSRNPTLLKATAALTKISANAKDPKDHLAWRVASLTTKSASPSQKSPSPSSAKKRPERPNAPSEPYFCNTDKWEECKVFLLLYLNGLYLALRHNSRQDGKLWHGRILDHF